MRELADGVAFWKSRPRWPADLDNMDYEEWAEQNPNGNFTLNWWHQHQLPRLRLWIATRPISGEVLTARFTERIADLSAAWKDVCIPYLDNDITTITWDEIEAFPNEVAKIKPMKVGSSAVFTSKFCHFLLPKIFPVVDNEGMGNRWQTYKAYFEFVQSEWESTDDTTRNALVAELARLVEETGRPVFADFPVINKIVELRLIGRYHPTTK
jgi:hypothetical protein